jgi:hypothetical protein
LATVAIAAGTSAWATLASAASLAQKVTPNPSATCLLGKWYLDLEVLSVDGKPFASGGQGTTFTFAKANGFTSSAGPMAVSVNFNASDYLTFFGGLIRTRTRGEVSGWVKTANGHLVSAGHFSQGTSQIEQTDFSGHWVTVNPSTLPHAKAASVPKIPSFQGWGYSCFKTTMVLKLSFPESPGSGFSWSMARTG